MTGKKIPTQQIGYGEASEWLIPLKPSTPLNFADLRVSLSEAMQLGAISRELQLLLFNLDGCLPGDLYSSKKKSC